MRAQRRQTPHRTGPGTIPALERRPRRPAHLDTPTPTRLGNPTSHRRGVTTNKITPPVGVPAHTISEYLPCASLGIKLVHSTPGRPQGRGKIERFFRTVREQFLVEITDEAAAGITTLAELNRLLAAWIETVYHTTIHSETGIAPLARWRHGIPDPLPLPSPAQLREAFLWSEFRTVTVNATVSLHNNRYQVDELLVGRKVELVFDPFDLTDIDIRYGGRGFGKAVAFTIGRHAHPKARPEHPDTNPGAASESSGIDYLRLLDTAHTQQLESRINYTALFSTDTDPDTGADSTEGA